MPEKSDATKPQGRDLFIVDNSVSGWTGLRYLEEWTGIANKFDIATGYFEIGSLLELDGKWQQLERIRILMGSETTHRTRELLIAVKNLAVEKLGNSIEANKDKNPFLNGVQAIQGITAMDAVARALRAWTAPLSIPIQRTELYDDRGNICQKYRERFDLLIQLLLGGPKGTEHKELQDEK